MKVGKKAAGTAGYAIQGYDLIDAAGGALVIGGRRVSEVGRKAINVLIPEDLLEILDRQPAPKATTVTLLLRFAIDRLQAEGKSLIANQQG